MSILVDSSLPIVMGIINLSKDSYYRASYLKEIELFKERVLEMEREGASIVDIGACSTRPGSNYVSLEEEWELLKPALKALSTLNHNLVISIDTFRSTIVERAFDLIGKFIVNDISAGEEDSEMMKIVAQHKLPYMGMHKRGRPENMQELCNYEDVVKEVANYLEQFVERALSFGISDIMVDPGFGFAKNIEQNYTLLNQLSHLKFERESGGHYPIVVGISRKSMIYRHLNIEPEESLPATVALLLHSMMRGGDILRVHDVKEAYQAIELYKIISETDREYER